MQHDPLIGNALDEIEEIVGPEVVRTLRLEFPGVRVYFGAKPKEDSALVQAIGLEPAKQLGEYFGGNHVTIPTGKAAARTEISERCTGVADIMAAQPGAQA
jgi:hypothetical protein